MLFKTKGSIRSALILVGGAVLGITLAVVGTLDRYASPSALASPNTAQSTGYENGFRSTSTEPRVLDEPFAQLIAASTGAPRLQNATIEFLPLGGLRLLHATIETQLLGGLRLGNSTVEVDQLGGLRLGNASIEFECDPGCSCPPRCDPDCDPGCQVECDDCNLNGVYDGCDIDSGFSLDNDLDGIPDECAFFTTGITDDWSDFNNWNLAGDIYPDNTETETYSVTLDELDIVFLDVNVAIDSLAVVGGATLLSIQDVLGTGDLTIATTRGILNEGTIQVANDRVIDASIGDFLLGPEGLYAADPGSTGTGCPEGKSVCASLAVGAMTIQSGIPCVGQPGTMDLSDAMTVSCQGDLVMDGTAALALFCTTPCSDRYFRGGRTPPILRLSNAAAMHVNGSLYLLGVSDFGNASSTDITVGGNFENQCPAAVCFDSLDGGLTLTGEANVYAPLLELNVTEAVDPIDLAPGSAGTTTPTLEPFDGTRSLEVLVLDNLTIESMTLNGLSIGGGAIALVAARVYEANSTDLVASVAASASSGSSVTLPLEATLTAGAKYRLAFHITSVPPGEVSATLFIPDAFPYSDSQDLLQASATQAVPHADFPTQMFEVAGEDLGSTFDGFGTGGDTNFAMGRVEVAAGRDARFANNVSNTVGDAACDEALYVYNLIFRQDSIVSVDNCRIYYTRLTQEADVTITTLGCGAIVSLCGAAPAHCDRIECLGTPECCPNGTCNTVEDSCSCSGDCGLPPSVETAACADEFDNDCDGCTDGADSDCGAMEVECGDGLDGDCDGFVDCADPDCVQGSEAKCCSDGVDNDADGCTDGADVDCGGTEIACAGVGADEDCDGCIDLADADCAGTELVCNDGLDDDCDGLIDCSDSDCVPAPIEPETTVPDVGHGTRVRYLSFFGGTPDSTEAARVQFDIGNGPKTMWVQDPSRVAEASGNSGTGEPGFWAATLDCFPQFSDWTQYDAIHVHSEWVIPGYEYEFSLVKTGCDGLADAYSDPLSIKTSMWGDFVSDCLTNPCAPPQGEANFDDISAVVDKFKNLPGAPRKSRADMVPDVLDFKIDFGDIPAVVDGFRGLSYPFTLPVDTCP